MLVPITNFFRKHISYKIKFSILVAAFLIIKYVFLFKSNFWISLLGDLISVPIVILIVSKIIAYHRKRKFSQIQLLTYFIGFEILFILFSETSLYLISPTLKELKEIVVKPSIFIGILSGFFTLAYIFFISVILSILTILFFSKQKKKIKNYYIITIIYFIISSLGANFEKYLDILWIKYTFGTLTIAFFIVLTYLNKWVVYLTRKEKLKVIGLCVVLLITILIFLTLSGSRERIEELIALFSSSVITAYNLILGMAIVYAIVILILTLFQLPATEVIERKTFEIESLQNLSQMISKVFDIEDLISFILDKISYIAGTNFIWICLFDEKNNCQCFSKDSNSTIDIKKLRNIIEKETSNPNEIEILDFYRIINEKNSGFKFEKIAYIPLLYNKKLFGSIYIFIDEQSQFELEDTYTLKSFGELAVIAIQNSRMLQNLIEKERIEKELEVARNIQRKLIPNKPPEIENLDVATLFIPAFEVGGDYFDFFNHKEDELSFVIADVSGKGISAAFYMAEVKGIFESLSKLSSSPKEILIQANKILCSTLDKKNFVSAVYGVLNLRNNLLKISRAGHCPIILIKDSKIYKLKPSGIAIGFNSSEIFENNLEEISLTLNKNDLLFLYTDGIPEARNDEKEEYGYERLETVLLNSKMKSCNEIINSVISEISLFSNGYPQHDDITMIIIKYLGVKNE